MKMYVICDNIDTQIGLRLCGIEGVVVHEKKETEEAINYCLERKDIAILLITEKLSRMVPELIDGLKLSIREPLLVVIPDRHGTGREPDSITKYVRDAIGVKL